MHRHAPPLAIGRRIAQYCLKTNTVRL